MPDRRRTAAPAAGGGRAVLVALAVATAAACAPATVDPSPTTAELREQLRATPSADLRDDANPTRDPRVVNAVWGDAFLRRATPLIARPAPAAVSAPAGGPAGAGPSEGSGGEPSEGSGGGPVEGPAGEPPEGSGPASRPLLVVPPRAPRAGTPGAAPTTVGDPGLARGATGRLFFTLDAVPRTCTAEVVGSDTGSVVATAGHCLLSAGDGGERSWAQNLLFVPGYRDGAGPAGRWFVDPAPDAVVVTDGWRTRRDWSEDVGFVRLLSRSGIVVQDVTGGLGAAFGEPGRPSVEVLGYPAAGRYDGSRVQTCRTAAGEAVAADPVDPQALGVPCPMTAGYSGGPWLAVGRPSTMVAVSSHDYVAGSVYGARLGPGALEAFRRADTRR